MKNKNISKDDKIEIFGDNKIVINTISNEKEFSEFHNGLRLKVTKIFKENKNWILNWISTKKNKSRKNTY